MQTLTSGSRARPHALRARSKGEDPNKVRDFVYRVTARGLEQQLKDACEEATRSVARSLQHTEILYPSGLVHDSFCERPKYWLCNLRQFANYTCSGAEPVETYRVAFISMGFRYVQMVGYPVRYRPLSHALDVADSAECAGHPDGRLADCSLRP